MSPQPLLERARQGDTAAIGRLLRQSLAKDGVQVQVRWQSTQLHLRLESLRSQDQTRLIERLRQGFERLGIERATAVHISSYRPQAPQPEWQAEFSLKPTEATQPAPTPLATETALAMACHLAPLLSYGLWLLDSWLNLPLGGSLFLLPWRGVAPALLLLSAPSPWLRQQARAALNFQLSLLIYWLVALGLALVPLVYWPQGLAVVLLVLTVPLAIAEIIAVLLAAVRMADGRPPRYWGAIPFLP